MNIDFSEVAKKTMMAVKEHMPQILISVGLVSGGACVVVASKQSMQLKTLIEQHKKRLDDARDAKTEEEKESNGKEVATAYLKTTGELARLYAPAILFGAASVLCILSGSHILSERNAALFAAYTTIDTSYRKYRENVIKRHGAEEDEILRFSATEKIETVKVRNEETGKLEKIEKRTIILPNGMPSEYARFYDKETAKNSYEDNWDYQTHFLQMMEETADRQLKAYGYLFLNDVYESLGMEKTVAGQIVGWVYDKNSDESDNHVSFRMKEMLRDDPEHENGYVRVWLLDFNVDGPILGHARDMKMLKD